jgi:imidazole glycerol-phosphate synthase subunit HisF
MIKKRVITTLLWDGHSLVKGKGFCARRRVGSLMQMIRVCESRNIDELVILDVAATPEGRPPRFAALKEFTQECFMPVAIGGGVRTLEHIRMLLESGADKAVIGSALFDRVLIQEASKRFGAQALVAAIDAACGMVLTECGGKFNDLHPIEMARQVVADGVGEILLTSITREGGEEGFDRDLIQEVSGAVNVPVIAAGGAGEYAHLLDAFNCGADAVAVGSGFLFAGMTPQGACRYLHDHGVATRLA